MSLQKHNHSDGQRNNSASIALNTCTVYRPIQQFLYRKAGLQFIFDQYEVLCVYKSITILIDSGTQCINFNEYSIYSTVYMKFIEKRGYS